MKDHFIAVAVRVAAKRNVCLAVCHDRTDRSQNKVLRGSHRWPIDDARRVACENQSRSEFLVLVELSSAYIKHSS